MVTKCVGPLEVGKVLGVMGAFQVFEKLYKIINFLVENMIFQKHILRFHKNNINSKIF
jgi:hypothetical protein